MVDGKKMLETAGKVGPKVWRSGRSEVGNGEGGALVDGMNRQESSGSDASTQESSAVEEKAVPIWGGDLTAMLASLLFHLVLLVALGLIPAMLERSEERLSLASPDLDDDQIVKEERVPDELHFSDKPSEQLGALGTADAGLALSLAAHVRDEVDIPSPVEILESIDDGRIEVNFQVMQPQAPHFDQHIVVKGSVGQTVTGATGAIDRITHEILMSLEDRKTLVVWMFDQSGSLYRQRQEIWKRFDRVYEELGVIEGAGSQAFKKHRDKPLLTSVVAFGKGVSLRLKKPTDKVEEIKQAVREIPLDDSGTERVFSAVFMVAQEYQQLRVPAGSKKEPERNVMMIVFTDEAGDDQDGLDPTVRICQKFAMPVYIVGVPAPFGRRETLVKWVDPDPKFDQAPQWAEVHQGPESLLPERIRLGFSAVPKDAPPIDSGFGPFALTRLAYETGGIYFAVHPNRRLGRRVGRGETAAFSAYLQQFFDPAVMREYRPDYVSQREYVRRANANRARAALLEAAQKSWVTPMEDPELRFVRRDEAALANALTEAQKQAARLAPQVNQLYESLQRGEADREDEFSPRWQAGFDLAMGRVLAVKVRTEAYNAMLAKAKRGLKFKSPENNTWVLQPDTTIEVGSQMKKLATRAGEYLQRVVRQHPGTPWAALAQQELSSPFGWKWTEIRTEMPAPRVASASPAGTPRPPRNDTKRKLPPRPPRRSPPKL